MVSPTLLKTEKGIERWGLQVKSRLPLTPFSGKVWVGQGEGVGQTKGRGVGDVLKRHGGRRVEPHPRLRLRTRHIRI